jgi:hypothetical protein
MRLAAGLACACALAAPASANASASVPEGFVGVNVDGPLFPRTAPGVDLGRQMGRMVSAGVESIRVVFDWAYAQPYRDWSEVPGDQMSQFVDINGIPTRWGELDQIVGAAAIHGITVMPTVLYAPGWDLAPHPSFSFGIPQRNGPFASFMTDLAQRYGPNGSFWQTLTPPAPIRDWQIWNEPNINVFWPKQPFQKSYAALLRAARNAVKAVDPRAKIVLAGLPNYSWKQLAKLYKTVPGISKLFDIVALHPYTKDPKGVITILRKARQVMNAAGDARKQIIADEISWPSSLGKTPHSNGFDIATTPAGQARKLAQMLPLLARDRHSLNLAGFFYYTWAGLDDSNGGSFDFSGLLHFDSGKFTAKPAFRAFRKAALAMEHCRQKSMLAEACAVPG